MSPNTNIPTTPATTTTNSNTSTTSGQGQRNRAQFKGSKSLRPNGRNRFNKKKRAFGGGKKMTALAPQRAPLNAYLSVCCSAPARKPQTGRKDKVQNPENGKSKEQAKGLGKWRCSGCGKATKVTVQRAVASTASPAVSSPELTTLSSTPAIEVTSEAPTA